MIDMIKNIFAEPTIKPKILSTIPLPLEFMSELKKEPMIELKNQKAIKTTIKPIRYRDDLFWIFKKFTSIYLPTVKAYLEPM